jgi:hypothetical protein
MDRRLFLSSLGATATAAFAGCGQTPPGEDSREDRSRTPRSSQQKETATLESRATTADPERQESATTESPELPLPGDPIRTANGKLDVQNVTGFVESESEGFDRDAKVYEFETEPQASFGRSEVRTDSTDSSVSLEVSADHVGTGRAYGMATGSFQTAWEAPVSGQYRLSSTYTRHASINYDYPDNGDMSASFDTALLATRHQEGEVISKRIHPELQHKNGTLREEVAEWFIETGIAYLITTTFSFGLIARVALKQIIGRLIELNQNIGNDESAIYDVSHRIKPNRHDPPHLTTDFEATEGEVFIFELTPTLSFGFELENSWWYQPTSVASADWKSFQIERIA